MRAVIWFGLFATLAWSGALPADPAAPEPRRVQVALELSQEFYYEGDPLNVRITVRNTGEKKVANPVKVALFSAFKVRRAEGETLKPTHPPTSEEPARPESLTPAAFYGAVANLAEVYPELTHRGRYEIAWSADGMITNLLLVTVIPRYDPSRSYSAEIGTDLGVIEIDLVPSGAPIAVKAFVDMANAGLYDALKFDEVQADSFVSGGDPRFADPPRRGISFPAEPTTVPIVAGTMAFRPVSAAPPANGPGFMIALKPQPAWSGQVTAFGQVTRGLEVLQRISRTPASARTAQPPGKPLRDVKIQTVRIHEKPAPNPS
jgi:cyclophilin family peptidyl-prolyl cis-trans isomerase